MSATSVSTGVGPGRFSGGALRFAKRAAVWARTLAPNQGWVTFMLVFLVTLSVTWSVESAEWAKTPTLAYVAFTGLLTGAVMAKVRWPAFFLHVAGLTVGFFTVLWFLAGLTDAGTTAHSVGILAERLRLWYVALSTDGISTDTLPFATALTVLVWLLGYVGGWSVFRHRNIWVPLIVSGIAILTNLSYLSDSRMAYFVLFLVFSFLAVAWMAYQKRRVGWSQQKIQHSPLLAAAGINDAFWFGVLAVTVAMVLPAGVPRPAPLVKAYDRLHTSVEDIQADFSRLFAGLPARRPTAYRLYDSTLPFQGTLNLSDAPVFTVKSTQPGYWRVRSYPTYTSKGWISGNTQSVPLQLLPQNTDVAPYKERETVVQQVDLLISPRLLAALDVPLEADVTSSAEVPVLPVHYIPLILTYDDPQLQIVLQSQSEAARDALVAELMKKRGITEAEARRVILDEHIPIRFSNPSFYPISSYLIQDLPEDLKALRSQLLSLAQVNGKPLTEGDVRNALPYGLHLDGMATDVVGTITGIYVRWQPSPSPDVLSIQSDKRLYRSDQYAVTSSVSVANAGELRQAGEEYPGWVRDLYLQLPSTLPKRVSDLARDLTAGAETPYDKALALQDYLHTLPYNLNIPAPAYNADGVDHFLFNTREGYSDYFGSAMAVMLRTVGVPTRMAVGYSPGDVGRDGTVTVKDKNSHGWTEVFFPGYGWVEFEPTPGRTRPSPPPAGATSEELPIASGGFEDPFLEDPFVETAGLRGGASQAGFWSSWLIWAVAGIGGAALVLLASFAGFRWLLGMPVEGIQVYGKLVRLSRLARLGPSAGQTPSEYGRALSWQVPEIQADVETVVEAYAKIKYGRGVLSEAEKSRMKAAWWGIRRPLFLHVLRRRGRRTRMPVLMKEEV